MKSIYTCFCRWQTLVGLLGLLAGTQRTTAMSAKPWFVIDSLPTTTLKSVTVKGGRSTVVESLLMGGGRSESIHLSDIDANVAKRPTRCSPAFRACSSTTWMVPATRSTSPPGTGPAPLLGNEHPSERGHHQLGYVYGYPASHYSPPMESIDRIEFVRGTASLQYGAQFGGMINYVTKRADTTRRFRFETVNAVGSFGLLSNYNAIGGRVGKWTYYAYTHRRQSNGYRHNSRPDAQAQFGSLHFQASRRLGLSAELGRSTYTYQIPGPLTDDTFAQNPRQSTRSRTYFNPDIYIPSLKLDWQVSERTRVQGTVSAVLGARNSVQLDAFATVPDTISRVTGQYRPRQVDIDNFNSYTAEFRLLHRYQLGAVPSTLAAGVQLISTDLHRRQLGVGTTASDFDLTLVSPFRRDLHFRTKNLAVFAENQFALTNRLTVSPGIRIEEGITRMRGTISYYDPLDLPTDISHR